jgi:hypothetical protein
MRFYQHVIHFSRRGSTPQVLGKRLCADWIPVGADGNDDALHFRLTELNPQRAVKSPAWPLSPSSQPLAHRPMFLVPRPEPLSPETSRSQADFSLLFALFALKIEFVLSSFLTQKNAKCCVSNKSLSSLPLFSIFFAFSAILRPRRAIFQSPSRALGLRSP